MIGNNKVSYKGMKITFELHKTIKILSHFKESILKKKPQNRYSEKNGMFFANINTVPKFISEYYKRYDSY